ncbi:hypothetical protein QAD02_003894 [Eretmocerus hayati]|uniref:Uncharacterized protein n=1 Tax=Eretmocerus hayati TaxID=131215 RepID=A0ACC2NN79_9HYME|nr:hypothetical protein QAD02_003894 [Eretmocerus hayati]
MVGTKAPESDAESYTKERDARLSSQDRKRTRSATMSVVSGQGDLESSRAGMMKPPQMPPKKQPKPQPKPRLTVDELKQQLRDAQDNIDENEDRFPLNFEQVAEFLSFCYGKTNVADIAASYTKDTSGLLLMLTEISDNVPSSLRHRMQRLKMKLDPTPKKDGNNCEAVSYI